MLNTFRHGFVPLYESYLVLNDLRDRTLGKDMTEQWMRKYALLKRFFEGHIKPHELLDALEKCATDPNDGTQKW